MMSLHGESSVALRTLFGPYKLAFENSPPSDGPGPDFFRRPGFVVSKGSFPVLNVVLPSTSAIRLQGFGVGF